MNIKTLRTFIQQGRSIYLNQPNLLNQLPTIFYLLPTTYYRLLTTNNISNNRFLCFFKKRVIITPFDFNRRMNGKFQAASNAKGKGSIPEYLP